MDLSNVDVSFEAPKPKASNKPLRVALLWQKENLGLYSNLQFDDLYKGVGHNNGNLAFVYAIASHIDNPVRFFPWHVSVETLKKSADVIVIPCANQIGKHTDLGVMADKLDEAGLPIVAIGLGAQADNYDQDVVPTEGTLRWAKVISKLSSSSGGNMFTRGAYTTEQLGKLGVTGAVTGGCPSYFINQSADLGAQIARGWNEMPLPRSISVAGGHQSWVKTREIEHQLIAMMMDPQAPGQYVVQSMGDMIKASRCDFDLIEEKVLVNIHKHTVPHYTPEEFRNWCKNYARSFYDVPSWMDSLRRYDLTIGSRYHGVALALQAGKMGLTITIDSRTKELCENTSVPNISCTDLTYPVTRDRLKKLLQFDGKKYDEHRSAAAVKYVSFLESNAIKPKEFLKKIGAGAS